MHLSEINFVLSVIIKRLREAPKNPDPKPEQSEEHSRGASSMSLTSALQP